MLIAPYQLFNWLNNMFPILPIDLRGLDSCDRNCALRRSVVIQGTLHHAVSECETGLLNDAATSVAADQLYDEVERVCVAHRRSVGENIAVLLCNGSKEATRVSTLLGTLTQRGSKASLSSVGVRELNVVDYDAFLARYCDCEGLFDQPKNASQASTDDVHVPRRSLVYYASEIVPGEFFLGDFENGKTTSQLKALGITHIVDATNAQTSADAAKELQLKYLPVNVEDHPSAPIEDHFNSVIEFVQGALDASKLGDVRASEEVAEVARIPNRVLFHCRAGWSRSPTLALVCMMKCFGQSLRAALTAILQARPNACPNPGFCTKLIDFERQLLNGAGDDQVSFETKQDLMLHVAKLNIMWSPPMTEETDYDRMPVRTALPPIPGGDEASLDARLETMGAFVSGGNTKADGAPASKRPFLRRGSGAAKSAHQSLE